MGPELGGVAPRVPPAIMECALLRVLGEHGIWPDFWSAFTLSATDRALWAIFEGVASGGGGGGGSSSSECKRWGGGGGKFSIEERGVVELLPNGGLATPIEFRGGA